MKNSSIVLVLTNNTYVCVMFNVYVYVCVMFNVYVYVCVVYVFKYLFINNVASRVNLLFFAGGPESVRAL